MPPTKPLLIAALILFTAHLACAQAPVTFERYYDFGYGPVEQAYCVEATQDGGYVMCGRQGQVGVTRLLLFKVDSLGIPEWHKTYGFGGGWAWGYAVKQTPDLGYVVTGLCTDANGYNVFVARCDQNGDTLWSKKYDPWDATRAGVDIALTDSGCVILARSVNPADTLGYARMLHFDAAGTLNWTKNHFHPQGIIPYAFKKTVDGGFIIAANTVPNTSDNNIYLIKTDASGDTLWTKTIPHPPGFSYLLHRANCINSTANGGYLISGSSINVFDIQDSRMLIIKTDDSGDTLGVYEIENTPLGIGGGNAFDAGDGNYFSIGGVITDSTSNDVVIVKCDTAANIIWSKTFGGVQVDVMNYALPTPDGGVVVCGMETSWGDGGGVYLIKTDSAGNAQTYITGIDNRVAVSLTPIALYPNPVTATATVAINNKENTNGTFSVFNALGEEVQVYEVQNASFTIYKDNLPPGLYLGVHRESKTTSLIKFIVQ